ncbi:MAG: hypothetical protein JWN60_2749 [Acidobacteria bacterium]|nr:hypothetical protein [Acidobacteriota bacterium]
MRQLSTNLTLFWRLFAIAWILFFSISGFNSIYKYLISLEKDFNVSDLILFILFGLISSIFVHFMLGKLKNVYLAGNTLIVSNFLKQITIPLSNVSHVDKPDISSLRRINIILKEPCEFGKEIVFAPAMFEAKRITNELKSKIETNYLSI